MGYGEGKGKVEAKGYSKEANVFFWLHNVYVEYSWGNNLESMGVSSGGYVFDSDWSPFFSLLVR